MSDWLGRLRDWISWLGSWLCRLSSGCWFSCRLSGWLCSRLSSWLVVRKLDILDLRVLGRNRVEVESWNLSHEGSVMSNEISLSHLLSEHNSFSGVLH